MHAEEALNECGIHSGSRSWYSALDQCSGGGLVGNANGISGIASTGLGGRLVESVYLNGGPVLAPIRSRTRIQGSRGALIVKQ
jgi:hypothetical protein